MLNKLPLQTFLCTATLSDVDQIKSLMETVFGPYPKLEDLFTKWITQDSYNVVVAKISDKVIGVSTWCLKLDDDFSKYESFGTQAVEFLKKHKLAWVVNLAVYPEYRRKNVGQQLSFAQLKWLTRQKSTAVVGSSWINGTNDNSQHLFAKAGFCRLGESNEFLRHQLKNGAECSVCKTSECTCTSILFGIKTSDLINFSATMNF